ncbi:MAG: Hsp20/alpha crystallin family protein [Dehalococcoidia bacterium]|nr:Hsp20/alpha crystallin family protein [Dehalococcoidia bacterium]
MAQGKKEFDPSDFLSGTLNILGIKLDLGDLLEAPEKLTGHLEELREKLKAVGGKETLSDEEWGQGGATITGHIRTGGLLGDQEYHIGTSGKPRTRGKPAPEPPEVIEPAVDVFDEEGQVIIVADVPGVSLEELELRVAGGVFSLSSKATARRSYRKELSLGADLEPESLRATCRNGVLEVRLRKRGTGSG